MTEINPICRQYGVQSPKQLTAAEQAEAAKLDDLAKVLAMHSVMTEAAEKVREQISAISDRAYGFMGEVRTSSPSATVRVLETLEGTIKRIDSLPKREQAAMEQDRGSLSAALDTMKRASAEISGLVAKLSPKAYDIFAAVAQSEEVKDPSATAQVLNALKMTAERMAEGMKSRPETMEKAYEMIQELCSPAEEPELVPIPVEQPEEEGKPEEKGSSFNAGLFLAPGYGHSFSGGDTVERGGVLYGGIFGSYDHSERLKLQIDYRSSGAYDFAGNDDLVYNNDDAKASVAYKGESFQVLGQAGWRRYRSDYPSEERPDINAATADIYAALPLRDFTVNLTLSGRFGTEVESYGDKPSFHGQLTPHLGISYHLPTESGEPVSFTLGPSMDSDIDDREHAYGGHFGVAHLLNGVHDLSFFAGYLKRPDIHDIDLTVRYDWNDHVGGSVRYNAEGETHTVSANLFGKVKLGKGFYFSPSLSFVSGVKDGETVADLQALLLLGWRCGEGRFMIPDRTKPFSIEPIPEGR